MILMSYNGTICFFSDRLRLTKPLTIRGMNHDYLKRTREMLFFPDRFQVSGETPNFQVPYMEMSEFIGVP